MSSTGGIPRKWTIADSAEMYGVKYWGNSYFSVNDAGNVQAHPAGPEGARIDLKELVDEVARRGIGLPLLIRFSDVLRSRIVELNETFHAQLVALAKSELVSRTIARALAFPFASPGALVPSLAQLAEWRQSLVVAQHQHRSLLEAISSRHGTRAEQIAREHARLSRRNLDLVLERREILADLPGAPLLNVDR